jgi:adenosylhomocysteine nucleosidase
MILLLSAMPEEIAALRAGLSSSELQFGAGREFALGAIDAQPLMLAFSRWGKVAAAATAAHALSRYPIQAVVFTGIAGALKQDLKIGDLVLADRLFQHDLDARPFFAPTEVPLLGLSALPACATLAGRLEAAYGRWAEAEPQAGRSAPT